VWERCGSDVKRPANHQSLAGSRVREGGSHHGEQGKDPSSVLAKLYAIARAQQALLKVCVHALLVRTHIQTHESSLGMLLLARIDRSVGRDARAFSKPPSFCTLFHNTDVCTRVRVIACTYIPTHFEDDTEDV